jgi:hypothetical protein
MGASKKLSLKPLSFEEAMAALLETEPPKKEQEKASARRIGKKKRAAKGRT